MSIAESDQRDGEREQAISRLKRRREFLSHLVSFLVINTSIWVIWLVTGADYPWPAWVTGPWSIGLLMNAWEVYLRRPITEAEIQREIQRLRPGH
jgi:hypothetical protein